MTTTIPKRGLTSQIQLRRLRLGRFVVAISHCWNRQNQVISVEVDVLGGNILFDPSQECLRSV